MTDKTEITIENEITFKFVDFETYQDYGWEGFLQILSFYPRFAAIDCSIQWDEYPATEMFPSFLLSIGPRFLFGFSFRWKWFAINCGIIDFNPRNLEYYRKNCND